jgi:hypothetical protein
MTDYVVLFPGLIEAAEVLVRAHPAVEIRPVEG